MANASTRRRTSPRGGRSSSRVLVLLCLLAIGQLVGATARSELEALLAPVTTTAHESASLSAALDRLEVRAGTLEQTASTLRTLHARRVEPLASLLARRTGAHPAHVERIALALAREGHRSGIDPRLLTAVLLVENPWLDPRAESPVGAVGLMQVMPFHAGAWGCAGRDLTHPETNICHGVRILAEAIRRTDGDLDAALLRYNGCVYGTNTPNCHEYPQWVYRHAGASWMHEIVAAGGAGVETLRRERSVE